jgi:hypothetical protein
VTLAVTVRPNGAKGALLAGSSNTTALHSRVFIRSSFWT